MIVFLIIIFTLGLLALPLGSLYVAWQRRSGNQKFYDPDVVQRVSMIKWAINIVLCSGSFLILLWIKGHVS